MASSADGSRLVAATRPLVTTNEVVVTNTTSKVVVTNRFAITNIGKIYTFQSTTATPALSIQASAAAHIISWSAAVSGVWLQQNADWRTTNWTTVATDPIVTNGQNKVVLPPQGGNRFYRLRKR